MWAWIFCWVFCATGNFQWCDGIVLEHRVGANLWSSDYEADTLPLHPCICKVITFMSSFPGFSGRFCSYRKPNFPAVSGSYLPGFSGRIRICSYWQPNFPAVSGSYLRGFSGLTFPGTRRPGFSGRSFSGMGNLKKLNGQQANCSGIYSGIFCT
jgi:hypothetical protein